MTDKSDDESTSPEKALHRLLDALGIQWNRATLRINRRPPEIRSLDGVEEATAKSMAAAWLKAIRINNKIFGPELTNAPAWTILVELYLNDRRPMSVSEVCIASDAPQTTALRYIQVLEQKGFIYREPCPNDRRRTYVHLSLMGREEIETAFALTAESDKRLGLGRLKLA